MIEVCLVTGANGHLGNNLVRALLNEGRVVRAGVRNINDAKLLEGLDCEIVYAEMLDKEAMYKAMDGVDTVYHVAAVFKHWAKNPEQEIVMPNVRGTEIVIESAAKANVKKVIYVSSVAAIGHNGEKLTEKDWNTEGENAYYRSKIEAEKKAWELSKKYNIWMAAVLPSAMIGANIGRFTDTMNFVHDIYKKDLPFDPNFYFNFVDVSDVANGIVLASDKGRPGERYILANESSSSVNDIVDAANKTLSGGYKSLPKPPMWLLLAVANVFEWISKISGKPADLMASQVRLFYGVKQEYSINKSFKELGYKPKSPAQALADTFTYFSEAK